MLPQQVKNNKSLQTYQKQISQFNNSMKKAQTIIFQLCQAHKLKVQELEKIINSLQVELTKSKFQIEEQNQQIESLKALLENKDNIKIKLEQLQSPETILLHNQLTVLNQRLQSLLPNQGFFYGDFLFTELYKHPDISISQKGTTIFASSNIDVFATNNIVTQPENLKFCCCTPQIPSFARSIVFQFKIKRMGEKITLGICNEGFLSMLNGEISQLNEYYLVDQDGMFYLKNEEMEQQIEVTQFKLEESDSLQFQIDNENSSITWIKNVNKNHSERIVNFSSQLGFRGKNQRKNVSSCWNTGGRSESQKMHALFLQSSMKYDQLYTLFQFFEHFYYLFMDQNQAQPLSKKQQKKLAKREKQKEHFKQKKILKKQIKKEKKPQTDNAQKKIKKSKEQYKNEMENSIVVIIDLQFMNQMTIQEKTSLFKQIELCHSMNFKSQKPLKLIVTSLTEDFLQLLNKSNATNWGIQLENKPYIDLYPQHLLNYLTGDTQTILDELKQDQIYIIGGLVDHNRLKQITYNKAVEQGINTLKLPIQVDLKTSSILTVNQVFEILLRNYNGENWNDAIEQSIPKRKKN